MSVLPASCTITGQSCRHTQQLVVWRAQLTSCLQDSDSDSSAPSVSSAAWWFFQTVEVDLENRQAQVEAPQVKKKKNLDNGSDDWIRWISIFAGNGCFELQVATGRPCCGQRQSMQDGQLEVVGVHGALQLGASQAWKNKKRRTTWVCCHVLGGALQSTTFGSRTFFWVVWGIKSWVSYSKSKGQEMVGWCRLFANCLCKLPSCPRIVCFPVGSDRVPSYPSWQP